MLVFLVLCGLVVVAVSLDYLCSTKYTVYVTRIETAGIIRTKVENKKTIEVERIVLRELAMARRLFIFRGENKQRKWTGYFEKGERAFANGINADPTAGTMQTL
ncbi:hypothetical protein GWI33_015213 [Rhynchophorus ferrugineus]|uniref:Uncharacterized protein n=1 Tax=Rhynchophorus ferrugineus TaxID=354439 RepID=A0A834IDR0_RHYFE|nr:hypothetical protein GWI33_015213 [Rhynchophorus ferrugineus]